MKIEWKQRPYFFLQVFYTLLIFKKISKLTILTLGDPLQMHLLIFLHLGVLNCMMFITQH